MSLAGLVTGRGLLAQWKDLDAVGLRADLVAGLTVGVMLVPQGMAYALVAGLPPIYGLYAGLLPPAVYALLGSSRHLAVGPVAMISLLVAATVAPMAGGSVSRYVELSVLLSLLSGGLLLVLGLIRAGFLANFLSHPVLTGFTAAAAVIIGSSQLKHVVGMDLPGGVFQRLLFLGQNVGDVHPASVAFGLASIATLVVLRRVSKRLPGALVVVALTTIVSWAGAEHLGGLALIGSIPAGPPSPVLPVLSSVDVQALLPGATVIALVGFMESIAISKAMAHRHGYRIDPDTELRALGAANLAGALFQSFPTTGGLSRTAVNEQAGASSNLAGLVAAAVIGLVLLFLTPLFYYLPKAALGAIILVAVAGLVDVAEFKRLWRISKTELGLAVVTGLATLALSVEMGILIGVAASLALVVQRSSRPHTAVLGRLPGSTTFRNVERNPQAETRPDVLAYRVDASLYFANIEFIADQILELISDRPDARYLVLDLYAVNRLDATAEHGLAEVLALLDDRGIRVLFAGLKGPVRDTLMRGNVLSGDQAPADFRDVHSAIASLPAHPADTVAQQGSAYAEPTGSANFR